MVSIVPVHLHQRKYLQNGRIVHVQFGFNDLFNNDASEWGLIGFGVQAPRQPIGGPGQTSIDEGAEEFGLPYRQIWLTTTFHVQGDSMPVISRQRAHSGCAYSGFDYVTIDAVNRRVYAAHGGSGRLLVADADTGKVIVSHRPNTRFRARSGDGRRLHREHRRQRSICTPPDRPC